MRWDKGAADALAEALFASDLQQSEESSSMTVCLAALDALLRNGVAGCAARVAQEFGDHPETAVPRMSWAIQRVRQFSTDGGMAATGAPPRTRPMMSVLTADGCLGDGGTPLRELESA